MSDEDDTRVLNMRINNKDFLKGTSDSLKALDTLNKGIDNAGKGKGMQNLSNSVDTVKTKFGAMQVAGVTALATITSRAVNAGINLLKGFTIAPITDGFREYQKILTSTQTIMANTGKSAKVAGIYLDDLNHYSDATIYNFGQMADNIGRFTAAGVKLPQATVAIKGLANSAALGGASIEQLNTAMYQTSQALSTGVIRLQDWNSLSQAGLGGQNIQKALKETSKTIKSSGPVMEKAIKRYGNFRDSLRSGWLTGDVFTKTMKVMAGQTLSTSSKLKDLQKLGLDKTTIAAIKAGKAVTFTTKDIQNLTKKGFSKEAIDNSLRYGKTVAFTVKQLQQMGYSKAAAKQLSKLSAAGIKSATVVKTFSQLIDVTKEAIGSGWSGIFRSLFGNLDEASKMWTAVSNTINGALDKIFGGVQGVLDQWHSMGGFELFWKAIGNIFKSVGNLFKPFVDLFKSFLPTSQKGGSALYGLTKIFYDFSVALEKVTSSTSSLSGIMHIIAEVVKGVFSSFFDLLKIFAPLGTAILGLVDALISVADPLLEMIGLSGGIKGLFKNFIDIRRNILVPFVTALTTVVNALTSLVNGDINFSQFKSAFSDAFSGLGQNIVAGIANGLSPDGVLTAIGKLVSNMLNYFKGLLGIHSPSTVFQGFGENIVQGLLNGLTEGIHLIVSLVKGIGGAIVKGFGGDEFDIANTISAIFSVGVFAVMLKFFLTFNNLLKGFKNIGKNISGSFSQLTSTLKTMQNSIRAKILMTIAISVGILAASLLVLSQIPAPKLAQGLGAVTGLLAALVGSMIALSKLTKADEGEKSNIASLVGLAGSMTLLASALLILSAAVLAFGNMDTKTLAKGMASIAVALGVMVVASIALSKAAPSMILAAGGVLILSIALASLAPVILLYSKMDWSTLVSGLAKMGASLVALAIAMIPLTAMGPMLLVTAASLVVLSAGLTGILAVIGLFSSVSWGTIIGGVAKIAAAIIALGIAGSIAAPGLIVLGAAAALIGVGMLAAGIGMGLFAAGLVTLTAAGTAAGAVLTAAVESFLSILPLLGIQFTAALISVLESLAKGSPRIVAAIVKIAFQIIDGFVKVRVKLFKAGIDMILGFIQALTDKAPDLIQAGVDLVVAILNGLASAANQLVAAAGNFILGLLNAIDTAINVYEPQILAMGLKIGIDMVTGLAQGLLPDFILTAISDLVNRVLKFFKGLLGINSPSTVFAGFGKDIIMGLVNGITGSIGKVVGVVKDLGSRIKTAFSSAFTSAASLASKALSGIVDAVRNLPGKILGFLGKFKGAGKSLMEGFVNGLKSMVGKGSSIVANLGNSLINGIITVINGIIGAINNAIPNKISIPAAPDINLPDNPIPKIPHFATGVTGFGGGTALVGEAGAELVTLNRGSNVITNKVLSDFIKQVAALTRVMSSASKAQNSPGGNIRYVVSADFQGDPRRSGLQFAANIAAGLINGLKSNSTGVNSAITGMATSMSESFAEVLGIQSPSTVFKKYAGFVGQGFINGLVASVDGVREAATAMGQAAIDAIAKTITEGQLKLESLRAKANSYSEAADDLRAKAKRTKSKKQRKRLEREADALDKKAKAQSKIADAQAKKVDAENAASERKAQYEAADTQGKADMKKEDAVTAADKASRARENAIRYAKEADLVRKYDKQRAKELDAAAKKQLANSKIYADRANEYAKESYELATQAKTETDAQNLADLNTQLQSVTAEDVAKAQAAFDSYVKSLADAQADAANDTPPVVNNNFEQNNYSPEAISPGDAYRNGKSLVSIMERKLVPTP